MAGRLMTACIGLLPTLAAGLPGMARAQLADPTRPPLEIAAPAGTAAGGATGETGSSPAASANTGLQSIILRQEGRPAALINGTVVELGGKVGDMRLVKVDEDSVVLLGPEGRETLKLIPGIEKTSKEVAGKAKPIGMNAYRMEKREERKR